MKVTSIPQVIPYQGSKRRIAPLVLKYLPKSIESFYEPFAGSAAVTVAAASNNAADQYVIGDVLAPLVRIWRLISDQPAKLADEYERIWKRQLGQERAYYDDIRDQFNADQEPAKLLFLIVRCVKNSVRFNAEGKFNQSPDNRRLGMHPDKMRERINAVARVLNGRTVTEIGDFRKVIEKATSKDFVYMDPPYQGTSSKKDTRYAKQLELDELVAEMESLNRRAIPFILSYDGRCGQKEYGRELPKSLKLKQLLVNVGRSSQSTLLGRSEETVESLYLSTALLERLDGAPEAMTVKPPSARSTRRAEVNL